MKRAIYPGSFDPATKGHLDIITRAARLFDEVVVVVMTNARKQNTHSFTVEERVDFLKRCTSSLKNVKVDAYSGLLAEYAKMAGAVAVVKGLRAVSDFEDEFQQSLTNKKLNPELETVFLTADAENMFLSSSVVKQVCSLGGDVSDFVPHEISDDIIKKLRNI